MLGGEAFVSVPHPLPSFLCGFRGEEQGPLQLLQMWKSRLLGDSHRVTRIGKPACDSHVVGTMLTSGCCVSLAASERRWFKLKRAGFRCFIFTSVSILLEPCGFLGF